MILPTKMTIKPKNQMGDTPIGVPPIFIVNCLVGDIKIEYLKD